MAKLRRMRPAAVAVTTVALAVAFLLLAPSGAVSKPIAHPASRIERPGSGCLQRARRSATPGVSIPAPRGLGVPPGTPLRPTEPNIASASATGGRASVRLSVRLQMAINEFNGQPLRGGLFGADICRRITGGHWQRVANPRWSVHAGLNRVLIDAAWLRAHSPLLSALTPGTYRIHLGLSYWWGQRNLVVRIR
jgi:hypothetical protein